MTHENFVPNQAGLTPEAKFTYSINRMPNPVQNEQQSRGSSPSAVLNKNDSLRPEGVWHIPSRSVAETQTLRIIEEERKRQILENSELDPVKRANKAEEVLGHSLTSIQKEAILSAHNVGENEKGKDGGRAEVFNYTQKQIAKKAKILERAGINAVDRRKLLESGIAGLPPEALEDIAPDDFADIYVKNIAGLVKDTGLDGNVDSDFIQSQIQRLDAKINSGRGNLNEAGNLLNKLEGLLRASKLQESQERRARQEEMEAERQQASKERFGLYLQAEDIRSLEESPIKWLDSKFDILYQSAAEGQELSSPVVNNMQTVFSEAIRWLEYNGSAQNLQEFQTIQTIRFNLLSMRTNIEYRGIENIQRSAPSLQMHGLMYGMSMEKGRVGQMFNRLHEKLEDERLKDPGRHIRPELMSKLQDNLISEQMDLAKIGIGAFDLSKIRDIDSPDLTPEQKKAVDEARSSITRSVKIAYDVFVCSQRQAVIIARGKHLTGNEAYFSDPASGPLNVYNIEDLLINKFDLYNAHDREFVEKIKLDMADSYIKDKRSKGEIVELTEEEQIDLGTRLFRDLFAVPDLFSSGWRIKGILDAIDDRTIAYSKAKAKARGLSDKEAEEKGEQEGIEMGRDLSLFMRLKAPTARDNTETAGRDEGRDEIWERIAEVFPEEVVRLFTDRAEHDSRLAGLFSNIVFKRNGVADYSQFKDKFGPVLKALRQERYKEMRQIRFGETDPANGGLRAAEKTILEKVVGAGEVQEMFRLMTQFSRDVIPDLISDNRFEDIHTRTLTIDDALLDKLEETSMQVKDASGNMVDLTDSNGNIVKFTALSKKYATGPGGDVYVRVWNDTGNAIKASQALIEFIKKESLEDKIKYGEEFSEATSQYNGQSARAKCIRFTVGSVLKLSKMDFGWDILGSSKGPFRKAISDIERIYGPAAKPIGREELRLQLDKLHLLLVGELGKNFEHMTPEEQEKKLEEVEAYYHELERELEVTKGDVLKRRGLLIFISAFIGVLVEGVDVAKKVA